MEETRWTADSLVQILIFFFSGLCHSHMYGYAWVNTRGVILQRKIRDCLQTKFSMMEIVLFNFVPYKIGISMCFHKCQCLV